MRKLTYSVVPRKNPADKGAPAKYYATAQARGYSSLEEIAEKISRSTTVTRADVKAVLAALEDETIDLLQNGEIVQLGDLGTFRASISSKGAEVAEEYNVSMIKGVKVIFRPSKKISDAMQTASFERVAPKKDAEEATEDEGGGMGV
ncbi:HU family DNA-binding protein [Phocaeicola coprophilus]|jgi:predicted histone-like DNA-binding protein|uniref:Putative DNA-binding protein n=1 Tax=Phocaeicola coprophilus DSM 18228 = JCM 13818 TaxID=547042 RepID=S0FA15_9BACT|nr:HU family DNA-binding protein [Phocaeicola coprophilus]EEF75396.1 putative DNA-binding protein [Phocaeicola coprophilus DSM 18228 = JCM 13818]QRO24947.1 HU family DNA-binding protein [Phocaeicola coprophilus]